MFFFFVILVCSRLQLLFNFVFISCDQHVQHTHTCKYTLQSANNNTITHSQKKKRSSRRSCREICFCAPILFIFFLIAFCFCFFFNFFYVSLFSVVLLFNFYSVLSILTNLNFILYSTVHHADHVVAECRRHRLLHTRGS